MKQLFLSIFLSFNICIAYAQQPAKINEAVFLHRAQQELTNILIADQFSLPVSIRIYTYSNIAAYEVLAAANKQFSSLHKTDKRFPDLSSLTPSENVHLPLAAVYAYLLTGKNFVYHEQQLNDALVRILQDFRLPGSDHAAVQASLNYGAQIAEAVYNWSGNDNYRQIRSITPYVVLNNPGKWIPTPPFNIAALEPYWGRMRCLVMDSASQFQPQATINFEENSNSEFYQQAKQVQLAVNNLNATEKATIAYWNDKHSIATKWLSIAESVCSQFNADIYKTAKTFTMTSLAMYDGMISCWDIKYRSNLLRPETFIRAKIDKAWNPYLKSLPTPEYTSHTALLSEAAAVVLSSLYGEKKPFTDQPEIQHSPRTFSSFHAAAVEVAASDLNSGVSFPQSIRSGREQGFQVGSLLVKKHLLSLFAYN